MTVFIDNQPVRAIFRLSGRHEMEQQFLALPRRRNDMDGPRGCASSKQTAHQHRNVRHRRKFDQQGRGDREKFFCQCQDVGAAIFQQEYLAACS